MSLIKLLLLTAWFNAFCWIILTPLWQYPDEQAHFAQVQYIAESGGIPANYKSQDTSFEVAFTEKILNTQRDESGNNKFTYHPWYRIKYSDSLFGPGEKEIINLPKNQRSTYVKKEATLNPPLYYSLSSLVYNLFSQGSIITRVFAIRIFSSFFFLGLVVVSYKIAQLLFSKSKLLTVALTSSIAMTPMLVYASTGILPDPLTNLLFSIFIFLCLKIILNTPFFLTSTQILFVLILGASTRQNFLIGLFILPFAILIRFITDKKSRKQIAVVTLVISMLLYISSYFVESLSFIRRFDYPESSRKITNNPLFNLTFSDHLKWSLEKSYRETLPWFWGIYKWLSLSLPPVTYQVINRLILISAIGLLIKLFVSLKNHKIKKELSLIFCSIAILVYSLMLFAFDYFFRKNNGYSFGLQGRYFFPVIIPIISLLLAGFDQVFQFVPKISKYAIFATVFLFFIFNDVSLYFVASSYYDTSNIHNFITQASQYKPLFIKGKIIALILFFSLFLQALFLERYLKFVRNLNLKVSNELAENSVKN